MQQRLLVPWQKYNNNIEAGMYPLMLSVAACLCLAFAGTGFAKTKHSAPKAPRCASARMPQEGCRQAGRRKGFAVAIRRSGPRPSRRHRAKCAPPVTAAS